jgi:general secretion pathway protein L
MADWLLLRLPREPHGLANWLVADAGGRVAVPQQSGPLVQAAPLAPGRRVCALVPSADVLLVDAEVPPKTAASKVLQVVPFALEEQLADDIESLHFAVGKRPVDSTRTPVAVVSRALMGEWLATLQAAGLSPDAVYADTSLIPANPGQAVALMDGDTIVVRAIGRMPVALPVDALAEALALAVPAAEEMPAEGPKPGLILYTGAAEWHQHSRQVEAMREKFEGIKIQLLTDGPLGLFAQQLPVANPINLLQGTYTPARSLSGTWRSWRIAAALLLGLLAVHTGGRVAELIMLKRAERALDSEIEQVFRMAMPGEQNASNARRRMEQKLLALQGNGHSGTGLLAALGALAQAKGSVPDTTIQALSFREGALDLKLAAPGPDSLDRMSQTLRASGWQAELTSGNVNGSAYEGRIQIRPRGS